MINISLHFDKKYKMYTSSNSKPSIFLVPSFVYAIVYRKILYLARTGSR